MKNKILYLLTAVAILATAVILFWLKPNIINGSHSANSSYSSQQKEQPPEISGESSNKSSPHLLQVNELITHSKNGDPLYGSFYQVPFDSIKNQMVLPLDDEGIKDGRIFVKYNPQLIESKKVGDTLNILAPELGVAETGTITNIVNIDSDIKQWQGQFNQGSPQTNHFRITRSVKDNYVLMLVFTDSGMYEMEAKNGVGWIRPSTLKGVD